MKRQPFTKIQRAVVMIRLDISVSHLKNTDLATICFRSGISDKRRLFSIKKDLLNDSLHQKKYKPFRTGIPISLKN